MSFGVRLGILSGVFIAMFGVLGLRLWSMQVTSAEEYQDRADNNLVKVVETPAPRGEIKDAQGRQIAGNRPALAAVIEGALLPDDTEDLVQRLAAFSGLTLGEVEDRLVDARTRGDRVTLVPDLDEDQAIFLIERDELFQGVTVVPQPVRVYPGEDLVPHVVGFIGRPDENDLDKPGIGPTDVLGKAGVEREYDSFLRGLSGQIKYQVNAQQEILDVLGEQAPEPGGTLELFLDLDVQQVLHDSLVAGLDLARDLHDREGCEPDAEEDPGCPVRAVGVVMDVTDGSVVAMSSVPGFDPNIFVGGVSQDEYDALPEGVFNNFAIQGEYAPASTFKAVTYVAAMENGLAPRDVASVEDEIECSAVLEAPFTGEGEQRVWRNWTFPNDDGPQNIHRALVRSCNTYFWDIAFNTWEQTKGEPEENQLQDWARDLGFGRQLNIDLPFERAGIVPDRALFEGWAENEPYRLHPDRLELASPWLGGDLMNLSVGQGSIVVTPLQLATAYAAMVNGGEVWQPRVVNRVVDGEGNVVFENEPRLIGDIDLTTDTVRQLRQDLQQVVNAEDGTAFAAFEDFGRNKVSVGGKTGTAQVIRSRTLEDGTEVEGVNTALFVGMTPVSGPRHVVVVIVERGGSGGQVAAATAKPVLQYLVNGPGTMTPVAAGEETD